MMQSTPRPSDKWIPWYFVAFFIVVAIVDGIFVTLAVSTHTGVITENAYQKGLDYNKVIEAVNKQDDLGWSGDIALAENMLTFDLRDRNGNKLDKAEVTAYFVRTSQAGYDFTIPLELSADGLYSKQIKFPLQGLWDVRILAVWNQQQYQKSQQIMAP